MRVLAALMTALFVYLAVGHLTGNAPNLRVKARTQQQVPKRQLWLIQAGSDLSPRQYAGCDE